MVRRKGELLELLRGQQEPAATEGPSAVKRPDRAAPPKRESAPRKPVEFGKWFAWAKFERLREWPVPWVAILLVVTLSVPLVWWLGSGLTEDPVDASTRAGSAGEPQILDTGGEAAPGAPAQPQYGVVAITYDFSQSNLERAGQVTAFLKGQLPAVSVRLLGVEGTREKPRFLQIFVGASPDRNSLQSLLRDVRKLTLPGSPGKHDFATAGIRRYPPTIQ